MITMIFQCSKATCSTFSLAAVKGTVAGGNLEMESLSMLKNIKRTLQWQIKQVKMLFGEGVKYS